jgi:hypothetical protein
MNRFTFVCVLVVLALIVSQPVFAQENSPLDLTGTWRWIHYEDLRERHPGAYPGDHIGIPLNDAARWASLRTYSAVENKLSELALRKSVCC